MSIETVEYAVLKAMPGEDLVTVPVGDEAIMRQTVADLLQQGATTADPVMRTVTEWIVDETTRDHITREVNREAILTIAQRCWEGEIDLNTALDAMEPHSRLPFPERTAKLQVLLSELDYEEAVQDDRVRPDRDQDKQTLEAAAERSITEAADALIGSSS